jgi:hypothetical protein
MRFSAILLSTALGLAVFTTGCDESDDPAPYNTQAIEDNMNSGTWRISSFIDSGQDETNDFNSYNFMFGTDGTLTASNGSTTYTGTWSVTDSNSGDDSPEDFDFNIYFNLTNDFEDLNDDWDIENYTTTSIELIDVSGGNGGTDLLTFTKN